VKSDLSEGHLKPRVMSCANLGSWDGGKRGRTFSAAKKILMHITAKMPSAMSLVKVACPTVGNNLLSFAGVSPTASKEMRAVGSTPRSLTGSGVSHIPD
jgi:hypothetical protein